MSDVDVVPLGFGKLMLRFSRLPKWMRELIREDMETAFENRIRVMERVNCGV